MPWPVPTIETIYQRIRAEMESRLTAGIKLPRASMLGITAVAFAGAARLMYEFIAWGVNQVFVDLSSEQGLIRWGNLFNLPRKEARYTDGEVLFEGTAAHKVAEGTQVSNAEGLVYITQDEFEIDGAVPSVSVVSEAPGDMYNTVETTLTLVNTDDDIDSEVTVVSGFDNGQSLETEENWIARLLQRFRNPPGSGNVGDYIRWALSVSGVDRAWCIPTYAGTGTLAVIVATAELQPVAASILTDAETYIEATRPIPAIVTYLNIVPENVDISIAISPNTQALREACDIKLTELFIRESAPGGTILLSHIRSAISAAGINDYGIIEIYVGGVANGVIDIETVAPEAAVFNSAAYSDL